MKTAKTERGTMYGFQVGRFTVAIGPWHFQVLRRIHYANWSITLGLPLEKPNRMPGRLAVGPVSIRRWENMEKR